MRVLEKLENCLHLLQVLLSVLQSERGVLAASRHVHIGLSFVKPFSMQSKGSQKKLNIKVLLENYCWKIAWILCVCKIYEPWLVPIYVLEALVRTLVKKWFRVTKKKKNRNRFKGYFSEGKVWGRKFIVEHAMGKEVIWRGKQKTTFQKMGMDY